MAHDKFKTFAERATAGSLAAAISAISFGHVPEEACTAAARAMSQCAPHEEPGSEHQSNQPVRALGVTILSTGTGDRAVPLTGSNMVAYAGNFTSARATGLGLEVAATPLVLRT
jgi:hypothetical protein